MSKRSRHSTWRRLAELARRKLVPWHPDWQPRAGEKSAQVTGTASRARLGQRAEEAVARRLFWRGYRIIARNLRNRYGELDIVALRGRTLAFIEVRSYREGASRPSVRLTPDKKRSLLKAASRFIARRSELRRLRRVIRLAEVCFDNRDRLRRIDFVTLDYSRPFGP